MRRPSLVAIALYVGVALALFAPALFEGRVFLPLHTEQMQPWRTDADPDTLAALDALGNPAVSDQDFLFTPNALNLVEAWRHGALPLWNPWILGGNYQLGQALDGAFYPPNLLYLLGPLTAVALLVALHLVVACVGMHRLLAAWGLSPASCLIGGLLFGLSGPLVTRFHYFMTFYPACWMPWLLLAVHRFTERPSWRRLLWVPWPVALIVLSGFPQTGLYGVYGAAAYGAVRLLGRGPRSAVRPLLWLGLAFAFAGLLAAVQVLPVLDAQTRSVPRVRDAAEQVQHSGSPWLLSGYVLGPAFVDPRQDWSASWIENPLWLALYCKVGENAEGRPEPQSWVSRPNQTEDDCALGAIGALLVLAAFLGRPDRRTVWLGVALLVGWSYALGFAPVVRLVHLLPGAGMGDVRRILPTLAMMAALLAAIGHERLRTTDAWRRLRWVALSVPLLLAVAWLWHRSAGAEAWWRFLMQRIEARFGDPLPVNPDREPTLVAACYTFVQTTLGRATLWWAVGAALLALSCWRRSTAGLGVAVLLLGVLLERGTAHQRYNTFVPREGLLREHPFLEPLKFTASNGRVHRYEPRPDANPLRDLVLPPNLGVSLGIDDAEGYIVAVPERYARYVRAFQDPATVTPVLVYPARDVSSLVSPLVDRAAIQHVLTQRDLRADLVEHELDPDEYALVAEHGPNRIYRNRGAWPFARVVGDWQVHRTDEAADEILRQLQQAPADDTTVHLEIAGDEPEVPFAANASGPDRWTMTGTPSRVRGVHREANCTVVKLEPGDGGLLYVAAGYDPGWQAEVDGEVTSVRPANVAFQALWLPPGAREVVLTFGPASAWQGLALTGVGTLAWLLLAALSWRRRTTTDPLIEERNARQTD